MVIKKIWLTLAEIEPLVFQLFARVSKGDREH